MIARLQTAMAAFCLLTMEIGCSGADSEGGAQMAPNDALAASGGSAAGGILSGASTGGKAASGDAGVAATGGDANNVGVGVGGVSSGGAQTGSGGELSFERGEEETATGDAATGGAATGGVGTGDAVMEPGTGGSGDEMSNGAGGSAGDAKDGSDCPFSGDVQYALNGQEEWPADVVDLLTKAMDEAIYYYNCYSDLSHRLTVNYKESVPTAEANVDGWMSFGSDRGYMVVATAMHEVGHTMGVGYSPWVELMEDGRWVGAAVAELLSDIPSEERDSDEFAQREYITGDSQHFWPYGLNQSAEHQSEWSLINHVRIVAAMQEDKETYRSR